MNSKKRHRKEAGGWLVEPATTLAAARWSQKVKVYREKPRHESRPPSEEAVQAAVE
jgi:hypothetical protein